MGIPKGTKLTDNPKSTTFKVRLDEETAKKLEVVSSKTKVSKAEVIRTGIDIQFEALKK
jgi:predicted DNA-binding protein